MSMRPVPPLPTTELVARLPPLWAVMLVGCDVLATSEPTVASDPNPVCDGQLQADEAFTDAPFDQDGDGFVTGDDFNCVGFYGPEFTDCDDTDPQVHPGRSEEQCNGVDDDCSEFTKDEVDADADGSPFCFDCDDNNSDRVPDAVEICWDGIDNNCDAVEDEGCGPNYNGSFVNVSPILYDCALSTVTFDFDTLDVFYNPPFLTILNATGTHPGALDTELPYGETTFLAYREVNLGTFGSCTEQYALEATFVDVDHITGTLYANFTSAVDFFCLGCTIQAWPIDAVRVPEFTP